MAKTTIEVSVRQAADASNAIRDNWRVSKELVQSVTTMWEWFHEDSLDLELDEDREAYDDFIEEVKMVLDLAGVTEYEISIVED